ncbi:MAG: hypothetical protein FJW14_01580 [Acidimicrobiia bacterium]|nr:hypothetical protein [Acidimicrobiia bacterium]
MKAFRQIASVAAAAALAGCGPAPPSPEHQTLTDFFEASRVRDTTVLARTASVVFEPRRDGVVQEFEVVDAGAETGPKQVSVRAQVRTPSGQVVERMLVVTMQREPGPHPWFITGFE